jgi:hypothetical protein
MLVASGAPLLLICHFRKEDKKGRPESSGAAFWNLIPATTYVPTQLPVQYHRPGEA